VLKHADFSDRERVGFSLSYPAQRQRDDLADGRPPRFGII